MHHGRLTTGRRRASGATLAMVTVLAGCGARSSLPDDACTWTVSDAPPVALTDPAEASALVNLGVAGRRVFVDTRSDSLLSPGPILSQAQVVSDDLTSIGAPHTFLAWSVPGAAGAGPAVTPAIAVSPDRRAALAYDDVDGCRFVPLADDGSPEGAPVVVDTPDMCFALATTATGFTALTTTPWYAEPDAPHFASVLALDVAGKVVERSRLVQLLPSWGNLFGLSRFDDGSMLLAWTSDAATMTVQHFSQAGAALSAPRNLGAFSRVPSTAPGGSAGGILFELGGGGSSALAVFPTAPDTATGSWTVVVDALDEDGDVIRTTTLTGTHPFLPVGTADRAAFFGWAAGGRSFVQPTSLEGEPYGSPLEVPAPGEPGAVAVAGTTEGALLAFDSATHGAPRQVFATRLLCTPEPGGP